MTEVSRQTRADTAEFRARLGTRLIKASIGAIVALGIAIMLAAAIGDYKAGTTTGTLEAAKLLLTTLLPLFGTWVGTVLAFYYSKENFEAATRSTVDLVRTGIEGLARTAVSAAMIPMWKISALRIPADETLSDLTFAEVEKAFAVEIEGRPISRLPIVDGAGVCRAMLHRSAWTEMRLAGPRQETPVAADAPLGAFLAIPHPTSLGETWGDLVGKSFQTIGPERNLADAKSLMERDPLYQDLIVTATGAPTEPMVGWLTNIALTRASRA